MAINVGSENISDGQWSSLERIQNGRSLLEVVRTLNRIVTDEEITSGREDLHPDWISLFNTHRTHLTSAPPNSFQRRMFDEIDRIFGELDSADPSIRTINPQEEKIAFLLGAGASKPVPSGIPTVAELLPELLLRARRLDQEQVTYLADFCNSQRLYNIEDLLTAVQISAFCSRHPEILRLVEFQLFRDEGRGRERPRLMPGLTRTDGSSVAYIQETLQVLFGLLSNLMLPGRPNTGHQAIADYLKANQSTPIITTNYDCCMDLALINNDIPFSYTVDFANPHVLPNPSNEAVSLIKLHGSLNWFYCETCQEVWVIDIVQTVADYENDSGEYPIIGVCRRCGGQRRGLLVPPHAMKFDVAPPLQPLISNAASRFEDRTLIVVVGFSFADADLYISRMLIKAMQASSNTRLVIVDPDRSVSQRVRRKFEAQIPNFDSESRILRLYGDCSEVLPQFLSGALLTESTDGKIEQPDEAVEGVALAVPQ